MLLDLSARAGIQSHSTERSRQLAAVAPPQPPKIQRFQITTSLYGAALSYAVLSHYLVRFRFRFRVRAGAPDIPKLDRLWLRSASADIGSSIAWTRGLVRLINVPISPTHTFHVVGPRPRAFLFDLAILAPWNVCGKGLGSFELLTYGLIIEVTCVD